MIEEQTPFLTMRIICVTIGGIGLLAGARANDHLVRAGRPVLGFLIGAAGWVILYCAIDYYVAQLAKLGVG